jgi:hypothetical protein
LKEIEIKAHAPEERACRPKFEDEENVLGSDPDKVSSMPAMRFGVRR